MKQWLGLAALALMMAAVSPLAAQTVPQSRPQVQLSYAPVVKTTAPAVVNIYTRKVVRTTGVSPLLADPFFRQFFGDMFGRLGVPEEKVQRSLGSGVIVRGDGLIVTNRHVVKESDQITVVLNDRREFEAQVLGSDERSDLAILKIDPAGQPLPHIEMGDSDLLEVGDLVLAIGNPFGVGQTVTSGIVSALARTAVGITDYRSFIQTDAAINPGNSGGALVDMGGRLVGINTAIYSQSGGSTGIGFAIPTSMVQAVITGITHGGKLVRPWLGVTGQGVNNEIAHSLNLPRPAGVLVNSLYPGGPGEQAGLKVGDIVMAINGREVEDEEALRFRIATLAVGGAAQLTVLRQGRETSLPVRLMPPPEVPPRDMTEIGGRNPFAGTVLANLNPALAEELGVQAEPGVVIVRLKRGSVANRLQFQPGDVVLKLNNQPVRNVAELKRGLDDRAGGWTITIRREGEVMSLSVGG